MPELDTRPEQTPLLAECVWTGRISLAGWPMVVFELAWWGLLVVWALGAGWAWWATALVLVGAVGMGALLCLVWLWKPDHLRGAVRAYEAGVVIEDARGERFRYTWNEVDGFRATWRAEGVRPWAPRDRRGQLRADVALALRDRQVSLAHAPPDQRERLAQAVEHCLREHTS